MIFVFPLSFFEKKNIAGDKNIEEHKISEAWFEILKSGIGVFIEILPNF